jgi:hypothetical protein
LWIADEKTDLNKKFWEEVIAYFHFIAKVKRCELIPVTAHESPYGCETSRFPNFVDNG